MRKDHNKDMTAKQYLERRGVPFWKLEEDIVDEWMMRVRHLWCDDDVLVFYQLYNAQKSKT